MNKLDMVVHSQLDGFETREMVRKKYRDKIGSSNNHSSEGLEGRLRNV